MNPLIKKQLDKIQKIKVPDFDDSTQKLIFPKSDEKTSDILQEDRCYIIAVEDYILHPPDGFTLHSNWNNNKIPKHKIMKIDVSKIMGKMIKVNSIGYDLHRQEDILDSWTGWLPAKAIKVIDIL
jgi:hypothetical protein